MTDEARNKIGETAGNKHSVAHGSVSAKTFAEHMGRQFPLQASFRDAIYPQRRKSRNGALAGTTATKRAVPGE